MEYWILLWKSPTTILIQDWNGKGVHTAQKALIARAQENSEASRNCYLARSQPPSVEVLYVAGYKYWNFLVE